MSYILACDDGRYFLHGVFYDHLHDVPVWEAYPVQFEGGGAHRNPVSTKNTEHIDFIARPGILGMGSVARESCGNVRGVGLCKHDRFEGRYRGGDDDLAVAYRVTDKGAHSRHLKRTTCGIATCSCSHCHGSYVGSHADAAVQRLYGVWDVYPDDYLCVHPRPMIFSMDPHESDALCAKYADGNGDGLIRAVKDRFTDVLRGALGEYYAAFGGWYVVHIKRINAEGKALYMNYLVGAGGLLEMDGESRKMWDYLRTVPSPGRYLKNGIHIHGVFFGTMPSDFYARTGWVVKVANESSREYVENAVGYGLSHASLEYDGDCSHHRGQIMSWIGICAKNKMQVVKGYPMTVHEPVECKCTKRDGGPDEVACLLHEWRAESDADGNIIPVNPIEHYEAGGVCVHDLFTVVKYIYKFEKSHKRLRRKKPPPYGGGMK